MRKEHEKVPEVLELARFRVSEDKMKAFLAKRDAMVEAAIRELPGLRRIEMVRLDDGTWVDVVLWDGRADSRNGLQNGPDVPAIGEWLATIDEDVEMVYGTVHDRATGRAPGC